MYEKMYEKCGAKKKYCLQNQGKWAIETKQTA